MSSSKRVQKQVQVAIKESLAPEPSIGSLAIYFVKLCLTQTLIAAICLAFMFELILTLADGFAGPQISFRDYVVYGLATVPLRIIFR